MSAPLAEIIEEGRGWRTQPDRDDGEEMMDQLEAGAFWFEHGPRLLAVAEAAVKYRHHITCGCGYPCSPRTAFDAAVRGEEK